MTRGESILALGKDSCLPAECEEALRCACAFTAAAGILRRRGGGAALSFTAGSVSVRSGGAGEAESAAIALEVQAARLMAPWCEGEDFAFLGVRA